MPDLAFVRNTDAAWTNLQENLGSDHHIVALSIRIRAAPLRIFKYVDWDLFRKIRDEDESEYGALEDLLAQVKIDVERATKEISTDLRTPGWTRAWRISWRPRGLCWRGGKRKG